MRELFSDKITLKLLNTAAETIQTMPNQKQQDSQEFLRYVLEGLHMEVNRVQKRPHPIKPDYEAEDRLP
ncbi:unnamed protein product [Trichobilharzia regenti]|nr:unnamed protein product [Trichobilharzia regenti]